MRATATLPKRTVPRLPTRLPLAPCVAFSAALPRGSTVIAFDFKGCAEL